MSPTKPARPSRLLRDRSALVSAAAGAVWPLGLARLIGEALTVGPLFTSVWVAAGLALIGGVAGLLLSRGCCAPRVSSARLSPLFASLLYTLGWVRGIWAGQVLVIGSVLVVVLFFLVRRAAWTAPLGLTVLTMALYLRTMLPSLGTADTFEFQVIVPTLGVAHPTGYPLYVLLTKLFTFVPLRSVAWRVSLASAVYATGAVVMLYYIVLRLTGRWAASILAALTLAFSSTFWSQAIVAEVYALHLLLVSLIAYLLVVGRTDEGEVPTRRRWRLMALLLGLGLANHLTTILLAPAVLLALLRDRSKLHPREHALAGALFVAGLSVYAFIPLRWPAINDGATMGLRQFVAHVSGAQFRDALRPEGLVDPARWAIVWRLIRDAQGWPTLALAGVGAISSARRAPRTLAVTMAACAAFIAYGVCYHVPDVAVFILPAQLVLSIWVGVAIAAGSDLAAKSAGRESVWVLLSAAALVPLGLLLRNLPEIDLSATPRTEEQGRRVLAQPLVVDSAILADPIRFAPLYYVQRIEGRRPDIDLVLLGSEDLYRQELASRLAAGQVVYLGRFLPRLEHYWLGSVGPLVRVSDTPVSEARRPSVPLAIPFGPSIELAGIDVSARLRMPERVVPLTLHWNALKQPDEDLRVGFRLVHEDGGVAWESAPARPVAGMYPTHAWRPGQAVVDYHELTLPAHIPSGSYALEVGLSPGYSRQEVAAGVGGDSWSEVVDVLVPAAEEVALPTETRILCAPGTWLTGHDAPRECVAGAHFELLLSWRRPLQHPMDGCESPILIWRDSQGKLLSASKGPHIGGALESGAFVTQQEVVSPDSVGEYTLLVGLANDAGRLEPVRCGWLARPSAYCELQRIAVVRGSESLAGFEDEILLVGASLHRKLAEAGDQVPVTLRWRAVRTVQHDYTVFVQLVGPDGRPHGQVDAWPVQGTLPTSSWEMGVDVLDEHTLRLDADAPPGTYTVHVGLYRLETMQRLRLIDSEGQPYGDFYSLGALEVRSGGS